MPIRRTRRARRSNAAPRKPQQQNNTRPPRSQRRRRRTRRNARKGVVFSMSAPGLAFLKCAFAPPDFNSDPGQGIPDAFEGKTLVRKDVTTNSLSVTGPVGGNETFILVAPTPGIAYWSTTIAGSGNFPTAASTWSPVYVPGFSTLFGTAGTTGANSRATQVSAFRYASQNVGVYPNSNLMQFAGAITVWKIPLRLVQSNYSVTIPTTVPQTIQQLGWVLNGLDGTSIVSPDNYVGTFIEGCFSQTACNEPEFEFNPIIEGLATLPVLGTSGNPNNQFGQLNGDVLGVGSMDGIIIRLSSPASAINSMIVKTWSCIEYRVNPNSALFQSAKDSPPLDSIALAAYRQVAKEIPVAVPYHMNSNFWNRVQSILGKVISGASMLPGPIGDVARGVGATTRALQGLWM
jgi:hypothetical protein